MDINSLSQFCHPKCLLAPDEPVDDIRSTNLGRLARLPVIGVGANILYDFGIGTRGNSYTNSNRQYMGLIRPVGTER